MLLQYQYKLIHIRNVKPDAIYLLKVNNRNAQTRCEICPKLTINGKAMLDRCSILTDRMHGNCRDTFISSSQPAGGL